MIMFPFEISVEWHNAIGLQ